MDEAAKLDPAKIVPDALEGLNRHGAASHWLLDLLRTGDARDPADVLMDLEFAVEIFSRKFDSIVSS